MQQKIFFTRLAVAALGLIALLALAACGSSAGPKPTASYSAPATPSAQPIVPSNPPAAQNNPPLAQPTAPAGAPGEAVKPGGEGGGPEGGPSVASVTDPGGLLPSPATNNDNSQTGEEQMAVYRDPQNRFQVLFVNGWMTGVGDVAGSIKSSSQDRNAQISTVNSGGQSAMAFATADEANVKSAVSGYQRLALKPGQIPYGPVASLIYRYQAGQNPVTGKALDFITARVYVPRQGSNDLAIITVTGRAPFYGDLTQIFDNIVISFRWL